MSGFGHYSRTADELEREILKRGIAIGIDWDDPSRMRDLARRALSCTPTCMMKLLRSPQRQDKLTGELFALSQRVPRDEVDMLALAVRVLPLGGAGMGLRTAGGRAVRRQHDIKKKKGDELE